MKPRHFLIPFFLLLCIMLGGASLAGYQVNLALQLMALPILVAAFVATPHGQQVSARTLQWLAAAMFGLMALQLVPLPPAVWTALPGRGDVATGFELLGQPLPWLPVSLSPDETLADILWLLPAAAVLFGMLRLGAFRPQLIAWTIVGATFVAILMGTVQVGGGASSPFYFYDVTNRGVAVGPFANANHMATLMLVCIPFLFALMGRAKGQRKSTSQSGIVTICAAMLVLVLVGLLINRSLAGVGLAVPVVLSSLLLLRRRAGVPVLGLSLVGLVSAAAVAMVFLFPIGNAVFGDDGGGVSTRSTSIGTTLKAAGDHLPLGSGFGSFAEVYRTHEDPATITSTYMNHAHSDYAEVLLEGGIPAALLIVALLIWWARRTGAIWTRDEDGSSIAKAASIAAAAILLHSLVDYPLRTAAIAALLAVCLALMTGARASETPRARRRRHREASDEVRHLTA